jgi:protein phosphatase
MNVSRLEFIHATRDSRGKRAQQEDFSAVWRPSGDGSSGPLLVVLADGMGGHVSGQLASRIACEHYISTFVAGKGDIGPRMARALDASNGSIAAAVGRNAQLKGMGCTLVAGYLDWDGLRWVSVGDSTLLLYRNGTLHRLNADHSHGAMLDMQAAAGIISEEAARTDFRRRALHSALTGDRIPMQDLELHPFPLQSGDWVIVASDGLLTLDGNEIATIIRDHEAGPAERLAEKLLDSVDGRQEPQQDNTTLVVVRVR